MDFDLDDPLADILSGGSDDSFFDDDALGRKKTKKKTTTPLASKKSSLFNLDDDIEPSTQAAAGATFRKEEIKKDPVHKSLESLTKPVLMSNTDFKGDSNANKARTTKSKDIVVGQGPLKQKLSNLERINSLERFETPKAEQSVKILLKRKSSNSLLDDILGNSTAKPSAQIKPPLTSKNEEFDFEALLGNKPITPATPSSAPIPSTAPSKLSLAPTKPSTASSKTSIPTETKQLERPPKSVTPTSKQPPSSADWLGIFSENETETKKDISDDPGMPAWLGGKDNKSKSKDPVPKTPEKQRVISKEIPHDGLPSTQTQLLKELSSVENLFKPNALNLRADGKENVLAASSEDLTQEGAAMYMQQQESQLMVALQLKAQEEKLTAMQMRQDESRKIQHQAAAAQQSQLASMLARQAAHRQQMQSIITAHQERINEKIKTLLMTSDAEYDGGGGEAGGDEVKPDSARPESPHAREKRQLLQLIQTLQDNHDKEIDLMETSYRRQIAISEAALQQCEERMRAESSRHAQHHAEGARALERAWRERCARAEEAARAERERHMRELDEARERHSESARALHDHHAALMENVKQAMQQERVLVRDSSAIASKLAAAAAAARAGADQSRHLVDTVQALHDADARERLQAIEAREAHITEMLQLLTRDRENIEKEKSEDRETVKLLENRLRQMTQAVDEETGLMKQKRMEFEFEKATFNKQTEFAKNVLKKQDEEIKMIKEEIQKEYQEKLAKIEEDKIKSQNDAAVVSKERITVQNLRQELERSRAGLQSQLEELSEERSRLAQDKQQLEMEEQRILAKSRDLDLLSKSALEKQSLADRKYSEAEYIQRKYEDRVRRLQEHAISLNSREKTIAREKLALSRERLGLHNEKRQLETRKQCSLCQSLQNQQGNALSDNFPLNFPSDAFLPSKYLSMGVSRDYAAGGADALEQQMSNFLSREITSGDVNGDKATFEAVGDGRVSQLQAKYKEVADPRLLLLRLDVQQVISNLSRGDTERPPADHKLPLPD